MQEVYEYILKCTLFQDQLHTRNKKNSEHKLPQRFFLNTALILYMQKIKLLFKLYFIDDSPPVEWYQQN